MSTPAITTAIPVCRYKFGEFTITILSEIESEDPTSYLYIAAILQDGKEAPEVYITCEPTSAGNPNKCLVRVLSDQEEFIISNDFNAKTQQSFCDFALEGVKQMYELSDEKPLLLG